MRRRARPQASAPSLLQDGLAVWDDLPRTLSITSEEVALLRAFLAVELTAILDGQDDVSEKA
ncbi:hypothetical protein [Hyphomicrobium sp. ghe19]|uniref:hypothetical protein n=1 Tax=Hyphomicrobium sp. ghe19 TaxID=2682968 RepID=UPI001366B803|nr:hypothetical protein HYPP_03460 [Hyphomicrobium sp. ghe19]